MSTILLVQSLDMVVDTGDETQRHRLCQENNSAIKTCVAPAENLLPIVLDLLWCFL